MSARSGSRALLASAAVALAGGAYYALNAPVGPAPASASPTPGLPPGAVASVRETLDLQSRTWTTWRRCVVGLAGDYDADGDCDLDDTLLVQGDWGACNLDDLLAVLGQQGLHGAPAPAGAYTWPDGEPIRFGRWTLMQSGPLNWPPIEPGEPVDASRLAFVPHSSLEFHR